MYGMHISSHAKGRLTRARTRSSAPHDAACPCTTPSVGGAGKNLVQHVRDLGSLQHAGVGQIKTIQTGGFPLGLCAQLACHRHHPVIRGTEGRAVTVEGKQQMMRQ